MTKRREEPQPQQRHHHCKTKHNMTVHVTQRTEQLSMSKQPALIHKTHDTQLPLLCCSALPTQHNTVHGAHVDAAAAGFS
mmetsp:Transcript_18318/g.46259  ORF Transcript_18318/g.46259 Transcript_18318/m.46259 type:complete len:80 (-) Transcript_18318:1010-1249(-)